MTLRPFGMTRVTWTSTFGFTSPAKCFRQNTYGLRRLASLMKSMSVEWSGLKSTTGSSGIRNGLGVQMFRLLVFRGHQLYVFLMGTEPWRLANARVGNSAKRLWDVLMYDNYFVNVWVLKWPVVEWSVNHYGEISKLFEESASFILLCHPTSLNKPFHNVALHKTPLKQKSFSNFRNMLCTAVPSHSLPCQEMAPIKSGDC